MAIKLTGKAEDGFKKWILENSNWNAVSGMVRVFNQKEIYVSLDGVDSFRLNALILEWFDEVGIYVNALRVDGKWYGVSENIIDVSFAYRKPALEFAILKSIDVYNNRFKLVEDNVIEVKSEQTDLGKDNDIK